MLCQHLGGAAAPRRQPITPADTAPLEGLSHGGRPNLEKVLASILAAAQMSTPEGQLPPAVFASAGIAARTLLKLNNSEAMCSLAKVVSLGERNPRFWGLCMRLLSVAARQLMGQSAFEGSQLTFWSDIFVTTSNLLCLRLLRLSGDRQCAAKLTEVLSLVTRTDLLLCLSQLLAEQNARFTAAAAQEGTGASSGGGGADAGAAGAQQAGCSSSAVGLARLTNISTTVVGALVSVADSQPHPDGRATVLEDARRGLRHALLCSHVVEHTARLGLLAFGVIASDEKALTGPLVRAFAHRLCEGRGLRGPEWAAWRLALLSGPCMQHLLLTHMVSQLCAADGGPDYGLPETARLPPLYATPSDLTESVQRTVGRPTAASPAASSSTGRGSAACSGQGVLRSTGPESRRLLSVDLMLSALDNWSYQITNGEKTRPCSDRALWALCERVVAAVHASWAASGLDRDGGDGGGAASARTGIKAPPVSATDGAADGASAMSSGAACGPCFADSDGVMLAVMALVCSGSLASQRGSALPVRMWAPAIKAVATALRLEQSASSQFHYDIWAVKVFEYLMLPPLCRLPEGGPLPVDPPPSLAAALAAGYVPTLERLIRHVAHQASRDGALVSSVSLLRCFNAFLGNTSGAAALFAYGDPRSAAALVASASKLLGVVTSKVCAHTAAERLRGGGRDTVAQSLLGPAMALCRKFIDGSIVAAARLCGEGSACLRYKHWWRRFDGAGAGAGAAAPKGHASGNSGASGSAVSGPSCSKRGGGDGAAAAADGTSSSASTSQLHLEPTEQLLLLCSFALSRWLPALLRLCLTSSGIAHDSSMFDDSGLLTFTWMPVLAHGYLDATSGAAVTSGDGSSGERDTAAATAAASWRHLLLQDLQLTWMVQQQTSQLIVDGVCRVFTCLPDMLRHLVVAFPDEARTILRQRQPCAGNMSTLKMLTKAWRGREQAYGGVDAGVVRHLLSLAPAVAAGEEPTPDDVERLGAYGGSSAAARNSGVTGSGSNSSSSSSSSGAAGSDGSGGNSDGPRTAGLGWAACLGSLLPPPCVATSLLGLPRCGNSRNAKLDGCLNLEGDSEAGLRWVPCKGCRGAVWYCSRTCQMEHWRAGHKAQCKGTRPG